MSGVDPDSLERAWLDLQSSWDDDQQHRRFLELSRLAGDLAGAGQRYREVRDSDPERAAVAEAQIDRLLGLAMQNMQVLRTPRRETSRVWLWVGTAITFAITLVFLAVAMKGPW